MTTTHPFGHIAMVWFDLDETLLDHVVASRRALLDLREENSLWQTVPKERWLSEYQRINDALWAKLRRDERAWDEIRLERFRILLSTFQLPADRADWMAERYLDLYIRRTTLILGALETVGLLRERGWPLGILTDGNRQVQRRKVEVSGLGAFVDQVIASDDARAFKPEARIFQYAGEAVGLEPSSLLYVGDSWENDVLGARGAGWSAVWVNDGPTEGGLPPVAPDEEHVPDSPRRPRGVTGPASLGSRGERPMRASSTRQGDVGDRVVQIRRIGELPGLLPR